MMAANGKISYQNMLLYITAQVLGGLTALGIYKLIMYNYLSISIYFNISLNLFL